MKKILSAVSLLILITACNQNKEPESKQMAFAGSTPIVSKVVSDNTYTMKNGDTTISQRWIMTMTENKSWPDKPVPPIDTVVVPPVPPIDTVVVPPVSGWPTFAPFSKNDFETSITTGFNSYIQQPNKQTTMFLSTDYVKSGSKSLKIDISKAQADAGANWRSELTHLKPVKTPIPGEVSDIIPEGGERWYKFWVYLPDYQKDNEESIIQWHQESGSGSPPCALYIVEDNLSWNYARKEGEGAGTTQTLMPIIKNKWFEVRMHFKFSSSSSGLSEIWIDGVKKLSLPGANMFSGQTNYMKLGLYKWPWKTGVKNASRVPKRILYFDDFEAYKKNKI